MITTNNLVDFFPLVQCTNGTVFFFTPAKDKNKTVGTTTNWDNVSVDGRNKCRTDSVKTNRMSQV